MVPERGSPIVEADGARGVDLVGGAVADEHRLAAPLDGELGAGLDIADIDLDRGQGQHVGRGVHLVDQRPDGGTHQHCARGAGGDVKKVAPCVVTVAVCGVALCLRHVCLSLLSGPLGGRNSNARDLITDSPSRYDALLPIHSLRYGPAGNAPHIRGNRRAFCRTRGR